MKKFYYSLIFLVFIFGGYFFGKFYFQNEFEKFYYLNVGIFIIFALLPKIINDIEKFTLNDE